MPRTEPVDVTVSLFHGVRPAVSGGGLYAWETFVSETLPSLLEERRSDKKRLPGFVLAPVEGKRTDANTGAHTALAIDVDHIPAGDLGALLKRASRYRCAVYETPSSSDEAPRVRVIAALGAEIQPDAVPAARRAFAEALDLDPDACGTAGALPASQVMFAGRLKGTRSRGVWTYEGEIWEPLRGGAEQGRRRAPQVDVRHDLPGSPVSAFAFDTPPDLSAIAKACPPAGHDGDRHTLVRALGGWLARRGYSPALIAEAVAREIPATDPAERGRQAQDAAERVLAGEEAPGWEALQRWCSVYGRKATLKRFEEACKDPDEPDGFGEPWSASAREWWPEAVKYWRKRNRVAKAAQCTRAPSAAPSATTSLGAGDFECDENGQPYSHAANVELGVRQLMAHAVARNAASGRVLLTEHVTLQAGASADATFTPGLWTDIHTTRLHQAVCRLGLKRPSRSDVDHAVVAIASERPHWPIRAYLESLPAWDGVERSLCTYFGVERAEGDASSASKAAYAAWVCAAWLRSCVARGMVPGCQVDHVLVLEGKQGTAKSSALRVLAGDSTETFGGFTANVKDDKRVGEQLQGKWIVEIAELDRWTRTYAESELKDVLTRREDDYRGAWDKHSEPRKRTAVFSGSTNKDEYLTDEENRRYWPIVTGWFDLAGLAADRAQLWAQALAEYRRHCAEWAPGVVTGLEWWPATAELKAMTRAEQDRRVVTDAWTKAVRAWVADQSRRFTAVDVAAHAVGLDLEKIDGKAVARVERCLIACGCVRTETKRGRAWRCAE